MSLEEEFRRRASELLRRFSALPEEKKVEVVKSILSRFLDEYRRGNTLEAGVRFLKFLSTPDGAIVWGYLARKEYAREWVELGVAILELGVSLARMLSHMYGLSDGSS